MINTPPHLDKIRQEKITLRFESTRACGFQVLQNFAASKAGRLAPAAPAGYSAIPTNVEGRDACEVPGRASPETPAATPTHIAFYNEIVSVDDEGAACINLKVSQALEAVPELERVAWTVRQGLPMFGFSASEITQAITEVLQRIETEIARTVPTEPTARLRWPEGISRLSREKVTLSFEQHKQGAYFLALEARLGKLAEAAVAIESFAVERFSPDSVNNALFGFARSLSVDSAGNRCLTLTLPEAMELSRDLDRALTLLERGVRPLAYRRPLSEIVAIAPAIARLEVVRKTQEYFHRNPISSEEFQTSVRDAHQQIHNALASLQRARAAEPVVAEAPEAAESAATHTGIVPDGGTVDPLPTEPAGGSPEVYPSASAGYGS